MKIETKWQSINKMMTKSEHPYDIDQIDRYQVPGSLEIPLTAKRLAKTDNYSLIIATGLIVDGGIYRHDFVANAVLQGMIQVQLDSEMLILSVVLTLYDFDEHDDTYQEFFRQHFVTKGKEAGQACMEMFKLDF